MLAAHEDFLGLAARSFAGIGLVVFTGASGSGKSTALEFLRRRHPDFTGSDWIAVHRGPGGLRFPSCRGCVVAIDEIVAVRELWPLAGLLRHNQVLVAAHLPRACFMVFAGCRRIRLFRTDRDRGKIQRLLERRGIRFSTAAVEDYCRVFGANYLDIEHILERCPGDDFDQSYAAFRRLCRLRRTPWGSSPHARTRGTACRRARRAR